MSNSRKLLEENIVALVILAVLVGFFIVGLEYSSRARVVPVFVAVASIVCMAIQILLQNLAKNGVDLAVDTMEMFGAERTKEKMEQGGKVQEQGEVEEEVVAGGKESTIILWLVGLVAMLLLLGYQITSFLYVAAYLRFASHRSWLFSILTGAITWAVVFLLFVVLLKVNLYQGIIFGAKFEL